MTSNLIAQDWDLLLRQWRDILRALSVWWHPSSSGHTQVTLSRGCRNTITRKKNKTGNEDFGIVSMMMTQEDTNASRVLWSIAKQREHHMITKRSLEYHSCNHRYRYGCPRFRYRSLNEGVSFMSMIYRTYRVTSCRIESMSRRGVIRLLDQIKT